MALEVWDFTVTIPPGTAAAAGFSQALTIPARTVTQINVRVPPGPRGEVGFAIGSGNINIIPVTPGAWIVTDDEDLSYTLDSTITSGAWQVLAYNTGLYAHSLRVYLYTVMPPGVGPGSSSIPIPAGSLTGDGGEGGSGGDGGTGAPPVSSPPTVPPPVSTPPVTPPAVGVPVILPPAQPLLPGQSAPVVDPSTEELLIGVSALTEVWLLEGSSYSPVVSQDDVTALLNAGIVGVPVSQGMHNALYAASDSTVSVVFKLNPFTGEYTLRPWEVPNRNAG